MNAPLKRPPVLNRTLKSIPVDEIDADDRPGRPPAAKRLAAWERLSGRFCRLTQPDQHRFFELHADAIERWLLGRKRG